MYKSIVICLFGNTHVTSHMGVSSWDSKLQHVYCVYLPSYLKFSSLGSILQALVFPSTSSQARTFSFPHPPTPLYLPLMYALTYHSIR